MIDTAEKETKEEVSIDSHTLELEDQVERQRAQILELEGQVVKHERTVNIFPFQLARCPCSQ